MADGPSGFGQCSLSLFQFMFHSRHVYGAHKCYQPFHTIAAISHTSAHQSRPDGQWKTPPFLLRQMLIPQLAQLAQLRTHKHAHNCDLSCTAFLLTQKKDDTYNKGHVPPTTNVLSPTDISECRSNRWKLWDRPRRTALPKSPPASAATPLILV